MTITRGKDMLLRVDDGTGSLVTVGGLRAKTFSFSASSVDMTNADSDGWRELLPCGGVRQADISGNGVFVDDVAAERARSLFWTGEPTDWSMVIPGYGTLSGQFQITNLDFSGEYRGESTFSLSLASSGELSFAPAVA
jgi:TP901-1 family phage major tail protein